MTATYRPIRCPHGTELAPELAQYGIRFGTYADGCRATSGAPVRFWCGLDEMNKPNGVSITEGEYLRDWQDAIEEAFHRWVAETKQREDAANFERDHAEALTLNEGADLYDEAAKLNEIHDGLEQFARHIEGHSQDPHPETCVACAHAAYLGEVPWPDRVDD